MKKQKGPKSYLFCLSLNTQGLGSAKHRIKATYGEKKCGTEFYDCGSSILHYKPWMVIIQFSECHLVDSTNLSIRKAKGETVTVAVNSEKVMRPE